MYVHVAEKICGCKYARVVESRNFRGCFELQQKHYSIICFRHKARTSGNYTSAALWHSRIWYVRAHSVLQIIQSMVNPSKGISVSHAVSYSRRADTFYREISSAKRQLQHFIMRKSHFGWVYTHFLKFFENLFCIFVQKKRFLHTHTNIGILVLCCCILLKKHFRYFL